MSNQVPPLTMPSHSRTYNQNHLHHANTNSNTNVTTTQSHNSHNPAWRQGQGKRRGQGHGRNYSRHNNPQVHTQYPRNEGHGVYYQHFKQQYQQPLNAFPEQEPYPLGPQKRVFHQHKQNQPFPGHCRERLASEQNELEHSKYLHRQRQQQQDRKTRNDELYNKRLAFEPAYKDITQVHGLYATKGKDFRAAYDNINSHGPLYAQLQPSVSEIWKGVWEMKMPNGSVEYWYAPKPVKLRGNAEEFVPRKGMGTEEGRVVWSSGLVIAQKEKQGGKDESKKGKKEEREKVKEDEEDEDAVLTVLPHVVLEADKVGRATTVGADDLINENAEDVDVLDGPAGFVVKKVSKKGSSGLFVRLNTERTGDRLGD